MMKTDFQFRKAITEDAESIWQILQDAIQRRKADGSNQWQDGYPNPAVVNADIEKEAGYVLLEEHKIVGYVSIMINDEPEYARLQGQWLTNGDFVLFHRVAIAASHLGKGLAQELFYRIEDFAKEKGIQSIKADTNFDNYAMLRIFEKLGYNYCGQVTFRGSPRKAFEKVISI
jgi:RimJ/RimL family protein N-acetyltransferase